MHMSSILTTCWGENKIITGPVFFYSGNSDTVAVFQVPKNQGVAVISLTLKTCARESLKQQSHEIQNKATTGEQIKWGTN